MNTFTRRITATVAGAAAAAGVFAGIALAAPTPATAAPAGANCTAAMPTSQTGLDSPNPLTRAAQVNAIASGPVAKSVPVSCLSR